MPETLTLKEIMRRADELSAENGEWPLEMHVYCRFKERTSTKLMVVQNVVTDDFGGVVFELVEC